MTAPSGTTPAHEPEVSSPRVFALFLAGLGSWFTAWGMQNVLFQWLVVEELGASASRVGGAQMAVVLPSLLFLLAGGATADRVDRRRVLVLLHALVALACTSLAAVVATGSLSYVLLIGYAVTVGTLQAFALPARDALLSDVVSTGMSRAVAGLTVVQHGGQALGALAAGLASLVGAPPVLGLQALVALGGALPTGRLPVGDGHLRDQREHTRLREGLIEVARSPVLRPVVLLNVSVGLVFVGTYLVLLPLLVRDLYGGGVEKMGLLAAALPVGSIGVNLGIVARGGIERPGLALLLGQGFAGLCLGALALRLPLWGSALGTLGWGFGAAFAINASRTLFQEHATPAHRGRVLAVYSLAILGSAPLGSLMAGLLAGRIGTLRTLALESVAMTLVIAVMLLFTRVRTFR